MKRKRKANASPEEAAPVKSSFVATPELLSDVDAWCEEAAQANGLMLYDVELLTGGRWIVRIYVDRLAAAPGEGVMIDECAEVSRYVEAIMDADERMPENYVLEVSSPGIERALKKPRHVELSVGSLVEVVVKESIDGQNKVTGKLLSFADDILTIQSAESDSVLTVAWSSVSRARLKFDFSGVKDQ